MTKVDRYAVVGNPIGHSRSPEIHRLFAQATHQPISYDRLEGPLDGFEEFALGLRDTGYLGLNVTIPFKLDASKLADSLTGRARLAGAVNTLKFDEDTIYGDNTDGIGFVRDITHRLGFKVASAAILVLGAGGGVRGLIASLLEEKPKWIAVANRTHGRAQELADEFGVEAIRLDEIPAEHFDLIVNGTSSSLNQDAPAIDPETFDDCAIAYDLVYAPEPTPFMRLAERGGAHAVADGLGMLIEQAAESFLFWRGVRPDTAPVYRELRRLLDQTRTSTSK
ncbi:MAG: shikimate dehydrogenase [Betaproteobacteria bacterium]|jgi:shikimate dehydrogenase|nr:MAG: shikimate dehydrogenase [Betaproteobacteria bacterium]